MKGSPSTVGFDPVRLIESHQAGVWRYLRALGCDPSSADDFTQETFLTVLQKPFDDYNHAATASYLRRVAHNLFISQKRREGKVVAAADVEEVASFFESWATNDNGEELLEALKDCFGRLKERAQLALNLRFHERKSRAEIAAALEITEHGAKNLMQRAKKQLRDCIESKTNERS